MAFVPMLSWLLGILLPLSLHSLVSAQSSDYVATVRCDERLHVLDQPWIPPGFACLEEAVHDPSLGAWAFTSLTVAQDGTLYALNAQYGRVYTFNDTDGDDLPDSPRIIIEGLVQPTGLAADADGVYILDGSTLYRWTNDELETIRDDIPGGVGFFNGGLLVRDEQFVIGTGAATPTTQPLRGALIAFSGTHDPFSSMMNDLTQPFDLAEVNGTLWGIDLERDLAFNDSGATIAFDPDSNPTGIAYYTSDVFPLLQNKLLVVLSGSNDRIHLTGYTVVIVDPVTGRIESLMPASTTPPDDPDSFNNEDMNLRGSGFFPNHPWDVAVSPHGWVYISVGGGRILALRPFATN